MATLRAFTAGVARVHHYEWYARQCRFVGQEVSELRKGPRMQNCSLLTPSRYPGADVPQFFDCDTPTSAFSVCDDLLGYDVINIGREATFASTEFPEFAARSSRQFLLEFSSKVAMSEADAFDGIAAVAAAIRVSCDLGHTQIDAEPLVYLLDGRLHGIAGNSQIPFPAMVEKIRLALPGFQEFLLARSGDVGHGLPATQRPNVDGVLCPEAKNAIVIGDCPSFSELTFPLFVELVGIRDFGKHANRQLRIEFELCAGWMVERLLKFKVRENLDLPRFATKPVCAFIGTMQRSQECLGLFRRGEQLDLGGNLQ